jgi:hypothetical protein
MTGSIYGAGIYSAGLYSWYAAWEVSICEPPRVREGYWVPPATPWPMITCGPQVSREAYTSPASANWVEVGRGV